MKYFLTLEGIIKNEKIPTGTGFSLWDPDNGCGKDGVESRFAKP